MLWTFSYMQIYQIILLLGKTPYKSSVYPVLIAKKNEKKNLKKKPKKGGFIVLPGKLNLSSLHLEYNVVQAFP